MTWYYLSVTLHVLAAMLWLGGMMFLAAVGAPVLRQVDSVSLRAELFKKLGTRFRTVGWAAIAVLLVTGVTNLWLRGFLRADVILTPHFWAAPFGRMLLLKLLAVLAMLVIQAMHDFRHGPHASRLLPGSPEALRFRQRAARFARVNALIGIVLVYFAVRLARGG
jgi:uncharacterized membrane protein